MAENNQIQDALDRVRRTHEPYARRNPNKNTANDFSSIPTNNKTRDSDTGHRKDVWLEEDYHKLAPSGYFAGSMIFESDTPRLIKALKEDIPQISDKQANRVIGLIRDWTTDWLPEVLASKSDTKTLEEFIRVSPKVEQATYRGARYDREEFYKTFIDNQDKDFTFDRLTSWTTKPNVAKSAAEGEVVGATRKKPIKVIFSVDKGDVQKGTSIAHLSAAVSQGEVIVSGKQKYKIKEVNLEKGTWVVKLKTI